MTLTGKQTPGSENVWISREEYERLQSAAASTTPAATAQASPAVTYSPETNKQANTLQAIVGVILALALIISMSSDAFRWFALPALGIFAIFAIMSLRDYIYQRKHKAITFNGPLTAATAKEAADRKSRYKTMLIIAVLAISVPLVMPVVFIVFLMIIFSVSGSPGS